MKLFLKSLVACCCIDDLKFRMVVVLALVVYYKFIAVSLKKERYGWMDGWMDVVNSEYLLTNGFVCGLAIGWLTG